MSVDRSGILYIWDLGKLAVEKKIEIQNERPISVAMNKDGTLIVAGAYNARVISILSSDTGKCICKLGLKKQYTGRVLSVAVSADGKTIVSGSREKFMSVWDLDNECRKITPKKHDGRLVSVSISADGLRAASGDSENSIYFWNLGEDECIHKVEPFVDFHLIGVDLRGAEFESPQLKERCRQNGAIVD